jgi:LmbE family N-acetylglucosaminyl deacetylase
MDEPERNAMTHQIVPHPCADARPRLLAVLAHPDDESFGTGGTLAFYSDAGAAVYLICTTGGEAGVIAPEFLERYGSPTATRTAELHCAAEKLGLTEVQMFGYRDSGMAGTADNQHPESLYSASFDEVVARITHHIRRLRPHVVITFDPIGGYRHPDHIITHRATVEAFHAAGDVTRYPDDLPPYQPQKLYYQVFPRFLLRLFVRLMPLFGKDPTRFGKNEDVDLTSFVNETFPIHARIDYRTVNDQREAAVACHASQIGSPTLTQSILGTLLRFFAGGESFMRAYPTPERGTNERDLFAGVEID